MYIHVSLSLDMITVLLCVFVYTRKVEAGHDIGCGSLALSLLL